jgi:hypothetical protein
VLAGGLHRSECAGQAFPRRVERRFARGVRLIDRAESATATGKARRRLRKVARLLERTFNDVDRLGNGKGIMADCAAGLEAMLAEGERRAVELASTL